MILKKLFPLLITLLFQLKKLNCGLIERVVANSIEPYRTNESSTGSYKFTFKITTSLTQDPQLRMNFPSVFNPIMANSLACSGKITVMLTSETHTIVCSISGQQLFIDLSQYFTTIDSGNLIVEINDIVNPSGALKQSSGNFSIRTYSGLSQIIDENTNFGAVAFSQTMGSFSSCVITNDGSNIAGYVTNYVVTFAITQSLPAKSWFRVL